MHCKYHGFYGDTNEIVMGVSYGVFYEVDIGVFYSYDSDFLWNSNETAMRDFWGGRGETNEIVVMGVS